MHQNRWRLELRPRPCWGSLQRSPDPLAVMGWDGDLVTNLVGSIMCPLARDRCPLAILRLATGLLPCLTTSATLWIPKDCKKSSLCFLSFNDTPHIHLTIIRSALSLDYADFQPSLPIFHFSPICQHTLDISSVYRMHFLTHLLSWPIIILSIQILKTQNLMWISP